MKVKVKREAGIDEFEADDHEEEEQDGRDENNSGGALEEDEEKRVLHVGRVIHVQAMKEKHAQAVRDFVQADQGKGDDDDLRLGIGEMQSTIFRTPKGLSTPQSNRNLHRFDDDMKKSKRIEQLDIERSTQAKWSNITTILNMTCTVLSIDALSAYTVYLLRAM